jgi:large subunit ribosomal protein L5e
MESLEEEDDERFKKQFSTYLAEDIGSEDIEELYTSAYAAIRENPEFKPTEKDVAKWKAESQKLREPKLTREQRRERVEQKIAAYKAGRAGAEEEEEEDDE